MYIPRAQQILASGLAACSHLLAGSSTKPGEKISSGSIMDFAVEKCVDAEGNQRCTTPFLVTKSTCYNFEWSSSGLLSHTTAEVRDAGSNELVHFQDADGEWKPEKGELVYVDFMPKVWKTGNATVDYTVKTC